MQQLESGVTICIFFLRHLSLTKQIATLNVVTLAWLKSNLLVWEKSLVSLVFIPGMMAVAEDVHQFTPP